MFCGDATRDYCTCDDVYKMAVWSLVTSFHHCKIIFSPDLHVTGVCTFVMGNVAMLCDALPVLYATTSGDNVSYR